MSAVGGDESSLGHDSTDGVLTGSKQKEALELRDYSVETGKRGCNFIRIPFAPTMCHNG